MGYLEAPGQGRKGTCFIVSKTEDQWFLLTNQHVTGEDKIPLCVKFGWQKEPFQVQLEFFKKDLDLALVAMPAPPGLLNPPEALMCIAGLGRGAKLVVLGFRDPMEIKIQPGICTGDLSRHSNYCMTTNAIVNEGDSGSPVLGTSGQVLGVAVASSKSELQEAEVIDGRTVSSFLVKWEKWKQRQQAEAVRDAKRLKK